MEQVSERLERLRQRRLGVPGVRDREQDVAEETPSAAPAAIRTSRQFKPETPVRQRFETRRVVKVEEQEEEGDEEIEIEEKKIVTRETGRKVVHTPKHVVKGAKVEPVPEKPYLCNANLGDILAAFAEKLVLGHTLFLRKDDEVSYSITMSSDTHIIGVEETSQAVKELPKPKVKNAPAVVSEQYAEFLKWWRGMTMEQKLAWCEQNSIAWEHSDAQLIENMRMSMAVQAHLGVSKHD